MGKIRCFKLYSINNSYYERKLKNSVPCGPNIVKTFRIILLGLPRVLKDETAAPHFCETWVNNIYKFRHVSASYTQNVS